MTAASQSADHSQQQQNRLLIVDDDPDFVEVLRDSLSSGNGTSFLTDSVHTIADAIRRIKRHDVDVVLLDLGLPDSERSETFQRIAPHAEQIPIIIISGSDDEDLAVSAVQSGAQDYLVKGQISAELIERVARHAIERKRLETDLREREMFFRLITENVQDLIVVLDRNGNRLYSSPSYRALTGDPEKSQTADPFRNIHPDDREQVEALFLETVATGIGRRAEYRFVTRSGAVRFMESQGNVIRDQFGKTERVVVMSRDITNRKRAEQELRESEQRYRILLDAVTDYIYSVKLHANGTQTTHHGKGCEKVTGYSREELQLNPSLGIGMVHEGDRTLVEGMVNKARSGIPSAQVEHRIRAKNGEIRWVRTTTVPHVDALGNVTSYDGLITDITSERTMLEQLAQAEALYQSLVESLPQCIMRKDINGKFTFVNNQFAELVGATPGRIQGRTDFDFYPKDLAEKYQADDKRVMESGKILETTEENISADGSRHYMQVVKIPTTDPSGVITGIQCIFWDVTAARLKDEELRRREQLLQAIMDQTPAVIYLKDPDGRYKYINREFEKLFHVKRELTVGKTDYDIWPPDIARRFRENDVQIIADRKPQSMDEQAPHDDGLHDYLSVKFPILEQDGRPYALCGISTDITERKRFEKRLQSKNEELKNTLGRLAEVKMQLIQAEKLKSIGILAAGVAHEVKNPLQILGLHVEELDYLISQKSPESEKVLSEMETAIDRASDIIKNLLEFARMDELKLRSSCLNHVVEESLRLMGPQLRKARVKAHVNLDGNLPKVRLDSTKMEQVMINLITNALHAMDGAGQIYIATRWRFLEEDIPLSGVGDTTHFIPGDRLIEVEMRDSGPGIRDDDLRHIFDPFFTTKPPGKGTGLGLPVVQNIVALHNATISIENHPDGGARVLITFKHRKDKHEKEKDTGIGR